MKIAESRDIKWKRKLNVDTDKVIEKVYHTNEFHQIVEDVLVSYVNDTVLKKHTKNINQNIYSLYMFMVFQQKIHIK